MTIRKQLVLTWMALLFLGGCGADNIPVIGPYPKMGLASWYSDTITSTSEKANGNAVTCAMRKIDFGKHYKVCNIVNDKCVVVRHNDFGPSKHFYNQGRIIDLTKVAFSRIANLKEGLVGVTIEEVSK